MKCGPFIIRKCQFCAKLIRQTTTASGNTFGSVLRTDGKRKSPMLPSLPSLVKCPYCQALLWIDEQKKIREIDNDSPKRFKYEWYKRAEKEDYYNLLRKGISDPEKERYLRLQVWWRENDPRPGLIEDVNEGLTDFTGTMLAQIRASHDEFIDEYCKKSDSEIENLVALAEILDVTNPSDLIMKAEIMRELRRWDDAIAILDYPFEGNLQGAANFIRDLAEKKYPYVAYITPK
ncbi:MAG: hypothetical protein ACOYOS_22925 [Syntrophales bacterium]